MALSRITNSQYGKIIQDSTYKAWVSGIKKRPSVRESSQVYLIDPKTEDELLILGTSNLSTVLGYHNLELAKKFDPTSVLLQVSENFGKYTSGEFVSSEDFQDYLFGSGYLSEVKKFDVDFSSMSDILYKSRKFFYGYLLNTIFRTPHDIWRLAVPGIDSKLIFELADELDCDIHYGGEEFNSFTTQRLKTDSKGSFFKAYFEYNFGLNDAWEDEVKNLQRLFRYHDLKSLVEGHFNRDQMAWFIGFLEKLFPNQKRSIIDKRDEDLFWIIEKEMQGNKKLVLLNQWHVDGVQKLWLGYHGLAEPAKPLMHTRDLPLEELQHWMRSIDHERELIEKRTGYPMMLHTRETSPYYDENRSHYA
jgi:hypothetical protein